jgi:hypothetical protein
VLSELLPPFAAISRWYCAAIALRSHSVLLGSDRTNSSISGGNFTATGLRATTVTSFGDGNLHFGFGFAIHLYAVNHNRVIIKFKAAR